MYMVKKFQHFPPGSNLGWLKNGRHRRAMAATLVLVGSLATVTHSLATVSEWRTVTFYDVLPEDCRAKVAENDVGNAPGDMCA